VARSFFACQVNVIVRTPTRPQVVSVLGVSLSFFLHALLLSPIWLNFGQRSRQPHSLMNSNTKAIDNGQPSAMELIYIENSDTEGASMLERNINLLAQAPQATQIDFPGSPMPDIDLPDTDDEPSDRYTTNDPHSEDPGRSLMAGRYVGQITARIERAWIRPRTPVSGSAFVCRVRIVQDPHGAVQEIELIRCNGDTRWQASLVQAIQSASPLPAPPDPDVYRSRFVLQLSSQAFVPGGSSEGFEPEARSYPLTVAVGQ
jgi:hypothetical protein